MKKSFELITILGPTACGKTKLAAGLAFHLNGEIISADSRQVYRGMNIGTGKDYEDYIVKGQKIPFHLIDIAEPGTEFNVYRYQQEFINVYKDIRLRNKTGIFCGGTGLYLESVLRGYKLIEVPEDLNLREELKNKSLEELVNILSSLRKLHNNTDSTDINRTIRAIEIETYLLKNRDQVNDFPEIRSLIFGINPDREIVRKRITDRLESRLKNGMIEEVQRLIESGITPGQLKFYGLEYKFLTMYVSGEIKYEEMFRLLNTAIHQFAKRQMTWFRKMEKKGFIIHWLDGSRSTDENLERIMRKIAETADSPSSGSQIANHV